MTDPTDELAGLCKLFGPGILDLLSGKRIELEHVELEIGELEFILPVGGYPGLSSVLPGPVPPAIQEKPSSLIPETFSSIPDEYPSRIREVTLGATKAEGGSRGKTITIGGSVSPPFTYLEELKTS